jgi:flagellin
MSNIGFNSSFVALSNLNTNQQNTFNALERMATGSQINRASDDPAGLIASENFASRLSAIDSQIRSVDRNISQINIQDGALGSTLSNISDLDSLVVQGSNGAGLGSAEMGAIQTQVSGALSGIERIASATGIDIMSDVTTEMVVGEDELTGDPIYETVSLSDLSRVIETDPQAAQALVEGAREAVLNEMASNGADARAMEAEGRVLREEQINIARANSQTRDADYAKESSALIRSQILEQASLYTVMASRTSASAVLSLLDISA